MIADGDAARLWPLKLLIFAIGAAFTALGILTLPHSCAVLWFLCAALTMHGMWRA